MKIKRQALEKIIEDEIRELRNGQHFNSYFAIYIEEGIEVQIKITKDEDDFLGEVLDDYESAKWL